MATVKRKYFLSLRYFVMVFIIPFSFITRHRRRFLRFFDFACHSAAPAAAADTASRAATSMRQTISTQTQQRQVTAWFFASAAAKPAEARSGRHAQPHRKRLDQAVGAMPPGR